MKEFFTRQTITKNLRTCRKRFPATICFTVALTLFLLFLTWADTYEMSKRLKFAIGYYLSAGSVLTLSLRLWGEEVKQWQNRLIAQIAAHALLAADIFYLLLMPDERFGLESGLAHASILTALCLTLCVWPFFRERDDIASWNFTRQVVSHAFVAIFIGLLMTGGLSLLTASLTALFGIKVEKEVYCTIWILCTQLLGTLLFIGRIPYGGQKHDPTIYPSVFLNKVIRFLFLPLLGCYLIVLYGYAIKILIEMQLPDGWITKLVTTLMFGCLCVEAGLYPSIRQNGYPFEKAVSRWLPMLILPMVILMSIAIGRRIADYGITVSRLYVLALNAWFYFACIGLFLNRARRIHWISISFATLFLLVSALPLNFVSLTRRHIRKEIHAILEATYEGKLPFDQNTYNTWMSTLSDEDAERTGSLLSYMDRILDDPEAKQIVNKDHLWFQYHHKHSPTYGISYSGNTGNHTFILVPQGCASMKAFSMYPDTPQIQKDTLIFACRIDDTTTRTVRVALKTLKEAEREEMEPIHAFEDEDYSILLTNFNLDYNKETGKPTQLDGISFHCSGYIFKKN